MQLKILSRSLGPVCLSIASLLVAFAPGALAQIQAQIQVQAQTQRQVQPQSFFADSPIGFSSSLHPKPASLTDPDSLPDSPAPGGGGGGGAYQALYTGERATRPFHSVAVGLTLGTGGIGIQLATPINTKINLRAGASFFSYNTSFIVDTIPINGTLYLNNIHTSIDYFPRARSFHISPGVTFYDNTRYSATIFVPGNQIINFNDQNYTSDPSDPIRGTAFIQFGRTVAPRLTAGFGNVIRHHTRGFSYPVEFGFEYIKTPTALFNLTGSSCSAPGDCSTINSDPETQQNINEQQAEINSDLKPFRIFPIVTFGISYKFGH